MSIYRKINDVIYSFFLISFFCTTVLDLFSQDKPESLPHLPFHLTARPWKSLDVSTVEYLNVLEGICNVAVQHQDENGAIIDPYLKREHQYSTPYFAFAVGTLLNSGKAHHLKEAGVKAMEHATNSVSQGYKIIPDAHGEFFISPLTHGIELYRHYVDEKTLRDWELRLKTPIEIIIDDFGRRTNNWRTYAMKGEWSRARLDYVNKGEAINFIESAWKDHTQCQRIMQDKWNLYQDFTSDPQSLAVEAVGRGNLIALVSEGYDGPSFEKIQFAVRRGSLTSLLLQSPDGQAPANGRTDNHVFGEVVYQFCFEAMAEDAFEQGDTLLAGRYRRAALLAFQSFQRWKRNDEPWVGSFYITKNYFEPGERVGYQPASQWGNYNGAVMQHLAESYHIRKSPIAEKPSPTEIGGYAFKTDDQFAAFFANAGGMQVVANLRGASIPRYDKSWTPLGVIRFSRVGWDARLGPSDGEHDLHAGELVSFRRGSGEKANEFRAQSGVTFGPEWKEMGQWIRIADLPYHYRATAEVHFVHPLLVRFSLHYSNFTSMGGPYFNHDFIITPDGVLTRLTSVQQSLFGLTLPVIVNDGRSLEISIKDRIVSTRYESEGDEQNFIVLNEDAVFNDQSQSILSTYGWLKPIRVETESNSKDVFVYPRNFIDPLAEEVLNSFTWLSDGFSTILGRVENNIYIGRTSAGGESKEIDINGDGIPDVTFDRLCQFVLQLDSGRVINAESDRPVIMRHKGKNYSLEKFKPKQLQ